MDIDEIDEIHTYDNNEIAVPFFWHIHKTGGTTMKAFFSECLDLLVTSGDAGHTVNKKNDSQEVRNCSPNCNNVMFHRHVST